VTGARGDGELAIVLHTHMPYVEGFGTWPFGEEWLWEAMASSYLPLTELLEQGAPLTLSLTPVLGDQLAAGDIAERFREFLRDVRRVTHELDAHELRRAGDDDAAAAVEASARDYEDAGARLAALGGDLLGALAEHAGWTSAATHAVLPLLATDAGVRLQVLSGIDAHRARSGAAWGGGFWLPECGYAPWLDVTLADAGVHATCVELTGRLGLGAPGHLRPLRTDAGPVLVPIDRLTIDLVWGTRGYPAHPAYRDTHRLTTHHHHAWSNGGSAYDPDAALAAAREHARDFVARARERLRDGGLLVCALDTELLGHWWHEGVAWLACVVDECAEGGVVLSVLDDALERHPPRPAGTGELEGASSWGAGGGLATWDGPAVADLAFAARSAELDAVAAGPDIDADAVRHLLALQASDWAFLVSRELAPPSGRERAAAHREAFAAALGGDAATGSDAGLRNLAVHARREALLEP